MATSRLTSETPAVVAKRMSDLLCCFPSAAAGGVHWQTLISKYNERHCTSLDIASLGHSSALVAATALLWDTLRIVDAKDPTDPVVAIEDGVAMIPQPDAPATWPSLFKSLCEIVNENGSMEQDMSGDETARAVLVSQLKPLLQRHWHQGFDEGSLSYFTEQGKFVRVKKMKHLLQALMQWCEQRSRLSQHSEIDEALKFQLELVPSKKHNDLLLRCVSPSSCNSSVTSTEPPLHSKVAPSEEYAQSRWADTAPSDSESFESTASLDSKFMSSMESTQSRWADVAPSDSESVESRSTPADCQCTTSEGISPAASTQGCTDLLDQIAMLRAENANLRNKNCALERQAQHEVLQNVTISIPVRPDSPERKSVWDDPSEPPPFEYRSSVATPCASTAVPSSFFNSGSATPISMASGSHAHSGGATPSMTSWVWDGQNGQICSVVPMFYVMGDRGLHDIPNGLVQQTVSKWETMESVKVLPSYFQMGAREC